MTIKVKFLSQQQIERDAVARMMSPIATRGRYRGA